LLQGATIVFTNLKNYNLRYESKVISHTATTITAQIKSANIWDFTGLSDILISEDWDWEVDATTYGYTNDTFYENFVVIGVKVTSDSVRNATILEVEDTTGILVGDKIRIEDDTRSFEINNVSQVVDATHLEVTSGLSRTYYFSRNPEIKVLRNTFSNTHMHQIRSNEVETLLISDYLDRGYPSFHSHRSLPLISDVTGLIKNDSTIMASGSSSIIYQSQSNGNLWGAKVDLNNWLEGSSSDITGVGGAIYYGNRLIAGSTNGNMFIEGGDGTQIVPIVGPEVLESSSSNSSSVDSSSSSSSSYSSLSSSSSSSSSG